MAETEYRIVYCTVPDARTGKTIAEALLRERLCACVNRVPGLVSHYIYEGRYYEENEELLLIKTTAEAFENLRSRIEDLHPYDVPEIIATPIANGNKGYLKWLHSSVE